jgi:hypothetical protein
MGSILPRFTNGPRTYEAVEALTGGWVVEARAGGVDNPGVGVAAAASTSVLGVAQKDAHPNGGQPAAPAAGVLDVTLAPREVAVINDGHVPLKYSAATAYGAIVCSAGSGSVRTATAGEIGAGAAIGKCVEKGGVALGGTGLTRLNL